MRNGVASIIGCVRRPDITRGGGGGGARLCSGFLVIFAICLYGFAAAFMVSVGTKLAAYRNITQSGKRRSALNDCSCNVIMTPLYVAMPVSRLHAPASAVG